MDWIKVMQGVRSPSKYSGIKYLESLEADNYLGQSKEYSKGEVEVLLWEKRERSAQFVNKQKIALISNQWDGIISPIAQINKVLPPPLNLVQLVTLEMRKYATNR